MHIRYRDVHQFLSRHGHETPSKNEVLICMAHIIHHLADLNHEPPLEELVVHYLQVKEETT